MKRNRKTAFVLAAILILIAIVTSWVVFTFLPVSPERLSLTLGCLVVGIICSFVLFAIVTKLPDKRWVRVTACSLFALLASVPLASAAMPRIMYSRFGLSAYGVTPIPVLDFTANRHGVLWFRPKTHQITRTELDALITPNVDQHLC